MKLNWKKYLFATKSRSPWWMLMYEAFSYRRHKRIPSVNSSVCIQHEKNDRSMKRSDGITEIKAALTEIKQSNRPQLTHNEKNTEGISCNISNDNTHFKRSGSFNVFNNARNNHNCPPLPGNYTGIQPSN